MACCALLATPQRPRTCSFSPAVPRSLCPLDWADFLQQKEQAPWTPDYLECLPGAGREPQSPGEAFKPSSARPSFGNSVYQWEKEAGSCRNRPLQLCPLHRATGMWFTASLHPLRSSSSSSSSSSKQPFHTGS